jgi:hypothetical protein
MHINKTGGFDMSTYLFVYHGGSMPESEEEAARAMQAWGEWFESIGTDVIDGGNPVGLSTTVNSDGSVTEHGGSNPASGYSLIEASSVDDAIEKSRRCPILAAGGNIELAKVIEM